MAASARDLAFLEVVKGFNKDYGLDLPVGDKFYGSAAGKCRQLLYNLFVKNHEHEIQACKDWLNRQPLSWRKDANKLLLYLTKRTKTLQGSGSFASTRTSSTTSGPSSFSTTSSHALSKSSLSTSIGTSMSSVWSVPAPKITSSGRYAPDPHMATVNSRSDLVARSSIDFRLNSLPHAEFFHSDVPENQHTLPLRVRYELQRLVCHYGMVPPALLSTEPDKWATAESAHKYLLSLVPQDNPRRERMPIVSEKVWDLAGSDSWPPELSMTACLEPQILSQRTNSLFKLRLNPVAYNEKSNRLVRKFGPDRFLKVMVPSASQIKTLTGGQLNEECYESQILKWLNTPGKRLLGCRWVAFFNKPAKFTQKQKKRYRRESGREVMFFAEEGPGLETMTREVVLNWFLDMRLNADMSSCKAYARIEMGFSTTHATIVFNPSQIREVEDLYGDGAAEDPTLKDDSFDWSAILNPPEPRLMTDGCGTLSHAAAKLIWTSYLEKTMPVPSAFQGRIGPWKGVWFVESLSDDTDDEDAIWIKVRPSQRKFSRSREDLGGDYDPLRLTFEVLDWSRKLSISKLYIEHLPILEDRGVSRDVFERLVMSALRREKEEAWPAMTDSRLFLDWMEKKKPSEHDTDDESSGWYGPRQKKANDIAEAMIQSGFDLKSSSTLADNVRKVVQYYFSDLSEDLMLPIEKSTSAIGVPDPFRCLAPDEIYLGFSDSDLAEAPYLKGLEALVSRHPSLRASDVQRVRVVFKEELMHLRDVVVFPTTGSYPLAGKLQGGDYDGDRFWICWDKAVVTNFRNSPPEAADLVPKDYGIEVDTVKCASMLQKNDGLATFFERSFRFQWQDSNLGQVTKFHEELRYYLGQGSMQCPEVKLVADIHDLVIDTAKNGYTFSPKTWRAHKRRLPKTPGPPLYKQPEKYKPNHPAYRDCRDVVDYLLFGVVRPFCDNVADELSRRCGSACERHDQDIEHTFLTTSETYKDNPILMAALSELEREIKDPGTPYAAYAKALGDRREKQHGDDDDTGKRLVRDKVDQTEQIFVEWYHNLSADKIKDPACRVWLDSSARKGFTRWELLKASALHLHWPKKAAHMFTLAGAELCFLKAYALCGTVPVVRELMAGYRYKLKRSSDNMDADHSFTDELGRVPDAALSDLDLSVSTNGMPPPSARTAKKLRPNGPSRLRSELSYDNADVSFGYPPTEVDTEPDTDGMDQDTEFESAEEEAFETAPAEGDLEPDDGEEVKALSQQCSQMGIEGAKA